MRPLSKVAPDGGLHYAGQAILDEAAQLTAEDLPRLRRDGLTSASMKLSRIFTW